MAGGRAGTYIRFRVSPEVKTREAIVGAFRLGEWLVEPRLNRLTRNGESIQIELKMMDVLVCLAEHGHLLSPG